MDITEIVSRLDEAIGSEFVASLAGLSLAAAAFFIPNANNTLEKLQERIKVLDKSISKGIKHGYKETPLKKELEKLEQQVESTKKAKKGLITAFMIFTFFVVYTVGLDSWIDENLFTPGLLEFNSLEFTFQTVDVVISYIFLGFAGRYLWTGTKAIGTYFDIDFNEEQKRLKDIFYKMHKGNNNI
ncbi:hypothetical protein [Croceivirga thetidis]|uniref:DUF106 domain-containing protein n=1 Tax=Croceivirga thetidis TaxID=2721623 RepID=A0ABX1GW52_9FLAO|nr:hypothetical protein [Croceivirga thetidis]NKI32952.1 hypothetical protein [Croceivirga thetidis]